MSENFKILKKIRNFFGKMQKQINLNHENGKIEGNLKHNSK